MTINKNIIILNQLLKITDFLEKDFVKENKTLEELFIEGVARKSFYYIYSINQLSLDEKNGDSVIDLARSLLESMINVIWILEFKKEEKIKKFMDYKPIELMENCKFAKDLDKNIIQEEDYNNYIKEYESAKDMYMRDYTSPKNVDYVIKKLIQLEIEITPKIKKNLLNLINKDKENKVISKSWAGVDFGTMLKELKDKKLFEDTTYEYIKIIYILGNRKNHLSPIDIDHILNNKTFNKNNNNMEIGLYISNLSYTLIITRFAEITNSKDLLIEIEVIKNQLATTKSK